MMKHTTLLILLLLAATITKAQSYRYIDITDGLSNQNVYAIQKDSKGYIWMLTMSGVDRYDGKRFSHYRPTANNEEPGWLFMLHRLHTDAQGNVWLLSMREGIMTYDRRTDTFVTLCHLPGATTDGRPQREITYSLMESNNRLWILVGHELYIWDTIEHELTPITTDIATQPLCIAPTAPDCYAVATTTGVWQCELIGHSLHAATFTRYPAGHTPTHINTMATSPDRRHLFVGTDRLGLYAMELTPGATMRSLMADVSINTIRPFSATTLLLATDRAGVCQLHPATMSVTPYLTADYDSPNDIDSNNIRDIYIDDEERVWMACNPYGVTVLTNGLPRYSWMRHAAHTSQSLCNNNVNCVMQDADGDLWFATNDGISLLTTTHTWHTLLSNQPRGSQSEPTPILALCEVKPGEIWATGHSDEIHVIDKRRMRTSLLKVLADSADHRADRFCGAICRDSEGYVWLGGYYALRRIDPRTGRCRYIDLDGITCIVERDSRSLWVGTTRGLYLIEKSSGAVRHLPLSTKRHTYICSLCPTPDGTLYVGTACSGLIAYSPQRGTCRRYDSSNSTLITDNIHTIAANADGTHLVIATDKGLTLYDVGRSLFRNWTWDQGLLTTYFNPTSGLCAADGTFVMGSNDGVVSFAINSWHDRPMRSRMVLSDMRINYEHVTPHISGSPLTDDIDNTRELTLAHDQSTFSIDLSSINYDYPSDVVYTWRLLGLHDRWTRLGDDHTVRYSSLPPGRYTLQIRAVSNESSHHVLEERTIAIRVEPPLWLSLPALLLYLAASVAAILLTIHLLRILRQRRASAQKIDFFVRSAHDIRTPLTLIKTPLEELRRTESLSAVGEISMSVAMRNVDNLLHLTDNLMNFERAASTTAHLRKSQHQLGSYVEALLSQFRSYAATRRIALSFTDHTAGATVWFDREKMDSILKNILSNALKYTPEGGRVDVLAIDRGHTWRIEVADTGIGIPASERRSLFRLHYRATNAINSMVAGSGVGLMLVKRLVTLHGGTVSVRSLEGSGTTVTLTIPKHSTALDRAEVVATPFAGLPLTSLRQGAEARPRLLFVEDNEELRQYLKSSLEESYDIDLCNNGKEALMRIHHTTPDLIISDIMMPEMRGDELCREVKSNIATSHIPVVLLSALGSEADIMHGLSQRADDYIPKPFSMELLRARIAGLLANRRLLWRKYASGAGVEMPQSEVDRLTELDRHFIDEVRRHVDAHIGESDFNVDCLCSKLNMSRTSFYTKIKSLTGTSPADIIRLMRLSRAATLLREGRHSVTEVAELTGFSDAKYFREVFKRHYNASPTAFAAAAKEENSGSVVE